MDAARWLAARELLLNTPPVANLIAEGKTFQLPIALASGRKHGMVPRPDASSSSRMAELSDIRRRLRHRIEEVRREAAARRGIVDQAEAEYERFLSAIAIPTFRAFATVLKADGHPFNLLTPERTVRLVPEGHGQDFVEIELDSARTPPAVVGRSRFAQGRRVTAIEQPLREGAEVTDLTEEDVMTFLIEALGPFLER